jgi:hypothetical protein
MMRNVPCIAAMIAAIATGITKLRGALPMGVSARGMLIFAVVMLLFGINHSLCKKRLEWEKEEAIRLAKGRRPRKEPRFSLPHLAQAEKQKIQNRIRPYCIFDYSYRLRLRSNYEDSTLFIDGPEFPGSSEQVCNDLYTIAATTLFVCEMHVSSLVGVKCLLKWMGAWLSRNVPTKHCVGLIDRISLLQGFGQ